MLSVAESRLVACPNCGKTVEWTPTAKWRPFCSERCKLIDLGRWLDGKYQIPVTDIDDDDASSPHDPDNTR